MSLMESKRQIYLRNRDGVDGIGRLRRSWTDTMRRPKYYPDGPQFVATSEMLEIYRKAADKLNGGVNGKIVQVLVLSSPGEPYTVEYEDMSSNTFVLKEGDYYIKLKGMSVHIQEFWRIVAEIKTGR